MPVAVASASAGLPAPSSTHAQAVGPTIVVPDGLTYAPPFQAFSVLGDPRMCSAFKASAVASTQAPTKTGAFRAGHGDWEKTVNQKRRQKTKELPAQDTNLLESIEFAVRGVVNLGRLALVAQGLRRADDAGEEIS
jgi:hypothetical protein